VRGRPLGGIKKGARAAVGNGSGGEDGSWSQRRSTAGNRGARWGVHAAAAPPVRRRARSAGVAGGFCRGGSGSRSRLHGRGASSLTAGQGRRAVGQARGRGKRSDPAAGRPGLSARTARALGCSAGGRRLEGGRAAAGKGREAGGGGGWVRREREGRA
jgi:hypothetical protein